VAAEVVGPDDLGPGELGPGELGPGELGPGELGPGDLGPGDLALGDLALGDLVEVELGPVAHGGVCVARHDGRVVFVRHGLPGERARARLTDVDHARYWRADAVEILRASPDRVASRCPHAGPGSCGGCDWQHVSLPAQRRLKAAVVAEQLRRLAGLDVAVEVAELPGAPDGLGWRTRVRFAVAPGGVVGLRRHRSHEVMAVPGCPIAHPLVLATGEDRARRPGATSVEVVTSPTTADTAVTVTPPGRPAPGPPAGPAGGDGPGDASLARRAVTHLVAGRAFTLDPSVFWQVHPSAVETLVAQVMAMLRPAPGETALDLYGGAGPFAAALAGAVGPTGRVVLVESDEASVRAAAGSLGDLPQVSIRGVRVTPPVIANLLPRGERPDVVVLDPPRAGAGAQVMRALLAGRPRGVAYVACDPASLARDVATAADAGYRLASLRAFDLFPMTAHVECVALLSR
jgi:tRNA/tmRNA/rRNA uracil-C5-methylase (TrmA/RlmC/RlmD family)